jgi:hypothetical protein
MKVDLPLELWEAIIVAIDNDLNEFKDCGTEGHPELDIRYGKMLQARGEILCARQGVENICMKGKATKTAAHGSSSLIDSLEHWAKCFRDGTVDDSNAEEIAYLLEDRAHDLRTWEDKIHGEV